MKMRRALGTHGTVHRVVDLQKRHDEKQTLPTLLCADDGCGASVRFVAAHERSQADGTPPIHVPACIALSKGAEHQPDCRYNAPGRLQAILANPADPEVLHALDDGRHELRLLVLQQAMKRAGTAQSQSGQSAKLGQDAVGSPLDRSLQAVMDLLVLRALCGDDDLLAAQVTPRLGKKRVDWSSLFYAQARYDTAWERLGAASNELPMAFVGTVRSHRLPQTGSSYGATYLNCAPKYNRIGNTDRNDYFEVSVGHEDAAWLQSFPAGAEIVMFGLWRLGKSATATRPHPKDPRRTITHVTHKLILWPGSKAQVVLVD